MYSLANGINNSLYENCWIWLFFFSPVCLFYSGHSLWVQNHTRHITSVVLFCMHMYNFAGLVKQRPVLTFSDTTIICLTLILLFPAQVILGVDFLIFWI